MLIKFFKTKITNFLGALALTFAASSAQAALLTGSSTPNALVDGSTYLDTIALTGGTTVTGVTITIDFTKCDDPLNSATCSASGEAYNDELLFKLDHAGTIIDLIVPGSYASFTGAGQRVEITFDDLASAPIGSTNGGDPESGTFQPVGSLADFIGTTAAGDWHLAVTDQYSEDPLWLTSWSLEVTSDDPAPVSEPGTMAILGLGLGGLAYARRRKLV